MKPISLLLVITLVLSLSVTGCVDDADEYDPRDAKVNEIASAEEYEDDFPEEEYPEEDQEEDREEEQDQEDIETKGIQEFLEDIDQEKRQMLIDEAMDRKYPVNWPMLWIVVRNINADVTDKDGNTVHIETHMDDTEAEYLLDELPERFANTVKEYTNGLVNVEIQLMEYDEVNKLSDDETHRMEPDSFGEIKEMFPQYNSIMVTSRFCSLGEEMKVEIPWAGIADVEMFDGNYLFCQVRTDDDVPAYKPESFLAYFDDNPVPEEGHIHEWLHTFEIFEELMHDCDGNPDTAGEHGYECLTHFGANGNYEFYKDLLNRNVWDKEKQDYVGMGEDLWRTYAMLMDLAKGRTDL